MKLTCTKPITLKTKAGPKVFNPGDTFEADLAKARPYIEKGVLRLVEDPLADLKPGDTIEWTSRIFGKLSGPVKEILGDGVLVVDHPLNDGRYGPATIRREGVTRIILRGEDPGGTDTLPNHGNRLSREMENGHE